MEKTMIKVQICQGTTCYVMGAANLVEWITALPDAIKCHLDISVVTASNCVRMVPLTEHLMLWLTER